MSLRQIRIKDNIHNVERTAHIDWYINNINSPFHGLYGNPDDILPMTMVRGMSKDSVISTLRETTNR